LPVLLAKYALRPPEKETTKAETNQKAYYTVNNQEQYQNFDWRSALNFQTLCNLLNLIPQIQRLPYPEARNDSECNSKTERNN
jgi:hypothetical protein